MKLGFLWALAFYLAAVLAAGLRFPRKIEGLNGFFLGGRRLGAARIAFSLCASWIGAATLLVSTDEAYRDGFSAAWIIGVPAVVTLLVLLAFARPVRALEGSTLSDLMEARYGRAARPVTTFLIVWYMAVLAASQLVAAGTFLKAFLGTSYLASLGATAAIVLVYSGLGGFLAVVRTHIVQFFLLVAGVAVLAISLGTRTSWAEVGRTAAGLGKSGYFDGLAHLDRNLLIAVSFVLAWTVSPIAWQRIQAARSDGASRGGLVGAAVLLAGFYAGIVLCGMLLLPLFPSAPDGVPLVSAFIAGAAGRWAGGLVFVAVLAAILSTMDAALNSGAFSLAGELVRWGGGRKGRLGPVSLGRLSTLVLGAGAFLVAARFQDILATLGLASKIMAEGLFIPGLAAVLWKGRRPPAGLLSLLAGGGYAVACFLDEAGLVSLGLPPWPKSLPPGIALSAGGFVLGLGLTFGQKWIKGRTAWRDQ